MDGGMVEWVGLKVEWVEPKVDWVGLVVGVACDHLQEKMQHVHLLQHTSLVS